MRTKKMTSPSVQLHYTIHIQEIKPWPPSQSLRTLRSVLIQWEHGSRNSGCTNLVIPSLGSASTAADGRIEFNESFIIAVTLLRELSIKSGNEDTFQRNCLEFNLYEPRSNKTVKGQLLGTAVIDFADYGVVKESLSITVPINCKRTYKNTAQPFLLLKVEPVKKRETSTGRSHGDDISASISEEYAEEAEFASFTDDDVSSHSSLIVSSSVVESNKYSAHQKVNGTMGVNASAVEAEDDRAREPKHHIAISDEDQSTDSHLILKERSSCSSSIGLSSDLSWISKQINARSLHSSWTEAPEAEKYSEDDPLNSFHKDDFQRQVSEDDGLVHGKSVQSATDSYRSSGSVQGNKYVLSDADNARGSFNRKLKHSKMSSKESRNHFPESRISHLEQRIKMLEEELREAAALEVSLYSVAAEHGSSMTKVHAPARRLLRLYLHACKKNSKSMAGSAAKSAVSGLLLVAKTCGNDVSRLTFWLSNSIVLRAIISDLLGKAQLPGSVGPVTGNQYRNGNKNPSPLIWGSISSNGAKNATEGSLNHWENPLTFSAALEKVEAWIFSRITESIWWQTFTPHMQSGAAKAIRRIVKSDVRRLYRRTSTSANQEQCNFSLELWEKAFRDACERICPVRAAGHECGCLHMLSRMIMEQCIARLDVSMFNAVLRKSADEIPTDPVADPITDIDVLPIQVGKASFGSGVQLKNVIGSWSRWLSDLCGIDDDNSCKDETDKDNAGVDGRNNTPLKSFHLLNALSDLMMLPKDMLLIRNVRKEVCPIFGPALIRRVLDSFVPDEFCPDSVPGAVLDTLDSEEAEEDSFMNFPCPAAPVVYIPPSVDSVSAIIQEFGSHYSVMKKSQTSDDELDELNSPLRSVMANGFQTSCSSAKPDQISKDRGSQDAVRYQLLREVWINSE